MREFKESQIQKYWRKMHETVQGVLDNEVIGNDYILSQNEKEELLREKFPIPEEYGKTWDELKSDFDITHERLPRESSN